MIWLDEARDRHCKFIVGHGEKPIVTNGVLHRIARVCGAFSPEGAVYCAHHTLMLRRPDQPAPPAAPRDMIARAIATPHQDAEPELTEVIR